MLLLLTEQLVKSSQSCRSNRSTALVYLGNANPSDKVRIVTPADILAEMSGFLNLAVAFSRLDYIDHVETVGFGAVEKIA